MGHGSSPKMIFFRSHKMSSPSGFEEMNCKFHSVSEYIRIICLINVIKHIHFVDDILVYWYHHLNYHILSHITYIYTYHLNLWSHISYYHQSSILRNKKMPPRRWPRMTVTRASKGRPFFEPTTICVIRTIRMYWGVEGVTSEKSHHLPSSARNQLSSASISISVTIFDHQITMDVCRNPPLAPASTSAKRTDKLRSFSTWRWKWLEIMGQYGL